MAIPIPTTVKRCGHLDTKHHHRVSHLQAQQTAPVDDQDGQPIPNTADVHAVDHGNQHCHSEGIRHLRHH